MYEKEKLLLRFNWEQQQGVSPEQTKAYKYARDLQHKVITDELHQQTTGQKVPYTMSKEKVKTLTDLLISFVYESNSVSLVQNLKNGISNTFDAIIYRDLKLERVTKLTKAEGFKCSLESAVNASKLMKEDIIQAFKLLQESNTATVTDLKVRLEKAETLLKSSSQFETGNVNKLQQELIVCKSLMEKQQNEIFNLKANAKVYEVTEKKLEETLAELKELTSKNTSLEQKQKEFARVIMELKDEQRLLGTVAPQNTLHIQELVNTKKESVKLEVSKENISNTKADFERLLLMTKQKHLTPTLVQESKKKGVEFKSAEELQLHLISRAQYQYKTLNMPKYLFKGMKNGELELKEDMIIWRCSKGQNHLTQTCVTNSNELLKLSTAIRAPQTISSTCSVCFALVEEFDIKGLNNEA